MARLIDLIAAHDFDKGDLKVINPNESIHLITIIAREICCIQNILKDGFELYQEPLKLEVGKYYRTRCNNYIYKCLYEIPTMYNANYPFICIDIKCSKIDFFKGNGTYKIEKNSFDLIQEVPVPEEYK